MSQNSIEIALNMLVEYGLNDDANRDIVAGHTNPCDCARALSYLNRVGILTPDNREVFAGHAVPSISAYALISLHGAWILTPDNREVFAGHAEPSILGSALYYLHGAGILTQENFDELLAPNHIALLSEAVFELLNRIPQDQLTEDTFQRLLRASEQANPITALEAVVNQILDIGAAVAPQQQFNQAQSTHTASVHASVSKSAGNLMTTYGDKIQGHDLDKALNEMRDYVNQLDDSHKHQAAKRAIERLTPPGNIFTDNTSGVSTRQLLALAWLAIHDDSKRQGDLADALTLIVEALYESQRGDNLNEAGVDNKSQVDLSICASGTFNKIIEKLVGIHPDVELKFITKEGAITKFKSLAEKHTLACLKELASGNPKDASELIQALKKTENLEPIWNMIKKHVEAELWDEFKEAYGNNPENQHFKELIEYGKQLAIPDEAKLNQILQPSQVACSIFKPDSDDDEKKEPESPKP